MEKKVKEKKKVSCKICKNEFKNYYFMNKHKKICKTHKIDEKEKDKYFIQEGNKFIYYLKKLTKNNMELNEVIVSKEGYIVPDDDSYPQNDDEEILYKLLKNCEVESDRSEIILKAVMESSDKTKEAIYTLSKALMDISIKTNEAIYTLSKAVMDSSDKTKEAIIEC